MDLSDWISIVSIVVALGALAYSIFSNTKKYELTYQYYNDILQWHNQVVEVLILLRLSTYTSEQKLNYLSKLSALIENGRFYFPNVDKQDNFGKTKPAAYQGYRNVILDFLVYEYQLFERDDYKSYLKHAENLQRLFTSYVFQYLEPKKQRKQIERKTSINKNKVFTINEFLSNSPEFIYTLYPIDSNEEHWMRRPTKRK